MMMTMTSQNGGYKRPISVSEPEILEAEQLGLEEQLPGRFLTPDELDPFESPDVPDGPIESIPIAYSLVPSNLDTDALLSADPLTAYLTRVRHIEPLPAEKQQELAQRYHAHKDS